MLFCYFLNLYAFSKLLFSKPLCQKPFLCMPETYCIIFVIVIVHELLISESIYYGDFILENS